MLFPPAAERRVIGTVISFWLCPFDAFFTPRKQVNQLNQLIELTRSELKRDDRQRIMSLITMDAHARDIVLMLIRENVTDKVRCRCLFLFMC